MVCAHYTITNITILSILNMGRYITKVWIKTYAFDISHNTF